MYFELIFNQCCKSTVETPPKGPNYFSFIQKKIFQLDFQPNEIIWYTLILAQLVISGFYENKTNKIGIFLALCAAGEPSFLWCSLVKQPVPTELMNEFINSSDKDTFITIIHCLCPLRGATAAVLMLLDIAARCCNIGLHSLYATIKLTLILASIKEHRSC